MYRCAGKQPVPTFWNQVGALSRPFSHSGPGAGAESVHQTPVQLEQRYLLCPIRAPFSSSESNGKVKTLVSCSIRHAPGWSNYRLPGWLGRVSFRSSCHTFSELWTCDRRSQGVLEGCLRRTHFFRQHLLSCFLLRRLSGRVLEGPAHATPGFSCFRTVPASQYVHPPCEMVGRLPGRLG
jgi:hypothetical protein